MSPHAPVHCSFIFEAFLFKNVANNFQLPEDSTHVTCDNNFVTSH